ncbi:hypothetical protein ONS96_004869 [Cadophora gregata f. sp. sojae]|nr:hypothetical protein ONS96_004869 [Cadophora gregata f. sp. sojae]
MCLDGYVRSLTHGRQIDHFNRPPSSRKAGIVNPSLPIPPFVRLEFLDGSLAGWLASRALLEIDGLARLASCLALSTLRLLKPGLATASENFCEALRVELPALLSCARRQGVNTKLYKQPPSKRSGRHPALTGSEDLVLCGRPFLKLPLTPQEAR